METSPEGNGSRAVERLFARFSAIYGAKFANAWAGVDPAELKRTWAEQLHKMPIEAVTGAINLCAKTVVFPPTLPEFMELCRGNLPRREPVVSLPAPIVHISNEAEEIASREYPKPANGFGTWWAKRILRLEELGQKMPLHSIQSAQQVLGVKTAVELRESEDPEARAERAAIESESV